MKKIFSSILAWFRNCKKRNQELEDLRLHNAAVKAINIREFEYTDEKGERINGYGLFVNDNLIEKADIPDSILLTRMIELRKFYFDMWKPQPSYKLL